MSEKSSRQSFSESAIISSVGIIFLIASAYMPFLQLLTFFTAVPYIIITVRNGAKYGAMAVAISMMAMVLFSNFLYVITLGLLFLLPGIVIGIKARRSRDPFEPISWGFISSILLTVVYIKMISLILGIDIVKMTMDLFEEAVKLQGSVGGSIADIDVNEIKNMLGIILPGLIVVQSMAMSFFNYYISLFILKRVRDNTLHIPLISEFTLPGNIALGILIIYFLTMSMSAVKWINYEALVPNITFIIMFMFFLQGFAVLGYFLSRTLKNRMLRNILLFSALLLGPFSSFISIIGFLDSIIDFRKIRRQQY